ncbi:TPR-like protein [Penicillium canescens]|uniref:TPR-like protein n=1 Tax=Penicillium canescens TaxID=5083 RepID=A0AAD6N2H3_PENCN|nr:TPR-like protein [Penicillium canescens]
MDSSTSFTGSNFGLQIGHNHGATNAHFHLPPAAEERPQPLAMIPFGRDPDFVDPGSLIDRVHGLSSEPSARLALVGFGGVGKSQIAIEYTYWIRERSPRVWVFWVHASDIVRYEEGLRDIAERVKIPRRQDPTANIFQLVGNWLQDLQEDRWVLILDNIDVDEYLHKPAFKNSETACNDERAELPNQQGAFSEKSPLEFLPRTPNGSVIITTRSKRIAMNLVNECNIITVEPSESHAFALLQRKLQDKVAADELSLKRLARELDWIALAIVQAATFIARHSPRCSVLQYLEMFREITLQLSFESIQKENPQAMDLLSLMSFFDRQGIPDYLLQESFHDDDIDEIKSDIDERYTPFGPAYQREKSNEQVLADPNGSIDGIAPFNLSQLEFEDSVATLNDYSFISIDHETLTFEMHGLVQLSIQEWLSTQERLEHWKEIFVRNLYLEFPKFTNFENISRSRALFPHVQSALSHGPDSNHRLRWARLIRHASDYVLFCDKPYEAKRMTVISRKETEDSLGWEHPETIVASAFEVKSLMNCEDFKTAEERCLQTIEACTDFHLETGYKIYLTFRWLLAEIYHRQGSHRWAESETEYKELWKTWEREHPDEEEPIISIKAALAELYGDQNRLDEAEILLQQVIESRNIVQTGRPRDVNYHMKNLASLYQKQGRHEEAMNLFVHVLESEEGQFGLKDPRTLLSMRSFACAMKTQSHSWEAMFLMQEVFEMQRMVLGVDHRETTWTAALLFDLLVENDELEAAASLAESLISCLDPDAHFALVYSGRLGHIYLAQGQGEKAKDIMTNSLERKRQLHGAEHDEVINAQFDLALWYEEQGQLREAEAHHQHMYQVRQRTLGSEHPETLTSLQRLVDLYLMHDGLVSSESLSSMLAQLSRSREAILGREDPQTLLNLFALSMEYNSQENSVDAATLQQEILEICLRKSGNGFDALPLLLEALVASWETLGRDEDAACLKRHIDFILDDMSPEEIALLLNSSKTLAGVLERSYSVAQASGGV